MPKTFKKPEIRELAAKHTNIRGAQNPDDGFTKELIPPDADLENLPSLPHEVGEKNKK